MIIEQLVGVDANEQLVRALQEHFADFEGRMHELASIGMLSLPAGSPAYLAPGLVNGVPRPTSLPDPVVARIADVLRRSGVDDAEDLVRKLEQLQVRA